MAWILKIHYTSHSEICVREQPAKKSKTLFEHQGLSPLVVLQPSMYIPPRNKGKKTQDVLYYYCYYYYYYYYYYCYCCCYYHLTQHHSETQSCTIYWLVM